MSSEIARSAQELEILVARSVRNGRLDLDELLDPYTRLAPGGHEHLANERRVDLDAMVGALATLPRDLLDAYEVLVVPRLDRFEHEPVESGMLPAGRLADGTLLIEASFSHVSLVNLVAPLCALAHEVDKAQPLLGEAGLIAPAEPVVAAPEELDTFEPAEPEPEPEPKPEPDAEPEDAAPAEMDSEEEGAAQVAAALARIAFALGVDQATLEAADDRTDGALLRLLLCQAELPEVRIHAEMLPAATARRATDHSQRILATLAEMGLVSRPTHLWIGGGVITECLSPYVRDLRQVLLTWASENPEACGDDIALHEPAGEDLLYALAHDFLRNDPALSEERKVADRTVGIQRSDAEGMPFEIVDLGRIDPSICDARLPPWQPAPGPAPILVRMTPDLEDTDGAGVHALVRALTAQLASVTVVLEGTALAGESGTIVLPHLMVQWAGEHKSSIPNTTPLAIEDFLGYADASVQEGAILSVSSAALLSPNHVGALSRTYGVAAIEAGAAGLVNAVAEARWAGEIPIDANVRWALIGSGGASTGRPNLATLSGYAAVAITALREILIGPRVRPEPEPEPPPKQEPPPPRPGRSFMIKA